MSIGRSAGLSVVVKVESSIVISAGTKINMNSTSTRINISVGIRISGGISIMLS